MVFIILVECFDIIIGAKLGIIISSFLSSSAPFFFPFWVFQCSLKLYLIKKIFFSLNKFFGSHILSFYRFKFFFPLISRPFYCLYSWEFSPLRSVKACHPLLQHSFFREFVCGNIIKIYSKVSSSDLNFSCVEHFWLMKMFFHCSDVMVLPLWGLQLLCLSNLNTDLM